MHRILLSMLMIVATVAMVAGATKATFSDTETSTGNTFSAGTLNLTVDGNDGTNTVKFNVTNMRPGNQPKGSYTLANIGTINGKLNIKDVSFTNEENGCVDPETNAGDTTCANPGAGEGELANVVNLRLFIDRNGDGWVSTGDETFFNGKVNTLPSSFTLDEPINAGANTKIVALLDWWNTSDDNKAQGDSMTLNLTFELTQ